MKEKDEFKMKICLHCNKEFIPAVYHKYRIKRDYMCSYNCYRKEGGDSGVYRNVKNKRGDRW